MAANFPNTGSRISEGRTNSGLSTQIIVKIDGIAVGAIQKIDISQDRKLDRIKELGTDGCIEIVPVGMTDYTLTVSRIVFDQLRLPEAFSRAFRFIAAQRIPFDIEIYDVSGSDVNISTANPGTGTVVMTYKNCWFQKYDTPYDASNYLITESATIWAETAYITTPEKPTGDGFPSNSITGIQSKSDSSGIESNVNYGGRRGSMDVSGLFNDLFGE